MTISIGSLAIQLPDGRKASFKEMQAYGKVMQDFIRHQESMMPQVADADHHNEIVDCLHSLTTAYNKQLRIYKVSDAQNQRQFMDGLLRTVGSLELEPVFEETEAESAVEAA